ncbi:MAG: tetratricopeptide repeat protein [Candidatus Marinimicrobia bacterium]|nr:tetratricopeptide repeat protein [Candidatus Neomarinimicrobiota bacterium]
MFRIIKNMGIILIIFAVAFSTSRVSFSRPGNMMNIPSSTNYIDTDSFIINASTDIYNFTIFNQSSSVGINTYLTHNINVGLSIGTVANPSNDLMNSSLFKTPVEFGLHYQHRVYSFKDISISLGVQDLIFNSISGFDANSASLYTVFSSERKFEQYTLGSYIGAGTGKIAANNFFYDDVEIKDQITTADGWEPITLSDSTIKELYINNQTVNVFLGFILKTPYLIKNGGIDLIGEYDGNGLNIGMKIPLSPRYVITAGIKNLNNIADIGMQSLVIESGNVWQNSALISTSPAIHFGVNVKLPKTGKTVIIPKSLRRVGTSGQEFAERVYQQELDSSLIYFDEAVGQLRDSLRLVNFKLQTINNHNQLLNQKLSFLGDSTEALRIKQKLSDFNQNKIVKHLTKSLKHYYDGDYISALQEAEIAIELNPNLAVAYARRGSIYYQLGDIKRARINWNMALKLDPEYDEVRGILSSVNASNKKGRL